jgi:hypothetical protein
MVDFKKALEKKREVGKILLPRVNAKGKPRISYSQLSSWRGKTAFNKFEEREISGSTGYILEYFLGYKFPDTAMSVYAPFGIKCEDYICERIESDLDAKEKAILDTIKPLGSFQQLVEIDFGDFVVEGFLDDTNEDRSIIRDYKTASKASAKKYTTNEYFQLDLYALDFYKKTGLIPQLEVVVIERSGSHFKPPLKVAGTFTIPRTTSAERLLQVELEVIETVREISNCYKLFLEINK